MEYLYVGKIVNTHGIKGELRIISKFPYKEKVFRKDTTIYIGNEKTKEVIVTYRVHKNFDMITLNGYNNINQVLKYKGSNVYINKEDLKLEKDEHLDSEYIGLNVMVEDKVMGRIIRIERYPTNQLIVVNNGVKDFLIPFVSDIIVDVDFKKKKMIIKDIKGLFE